jgi:hypothetical protein
MTASPWNIRAADERDFGLILDVLRHNALTRDRDKLKRLAAVLLQRTSVACNPDEDDHALGLCSSDANNVHIVYVKCPFRGMGIARSLLAHREVTGQIVLTIPARSSMIRGKKNFFYWIGEWI